MRKIRNTNELSDVLSDLLAWRKKEISTISLLIKDAKLDHIKELYYRTFIPILYAHWEGYAKEASNYYINYVSNQHLTYKDLATNFISISCYKEIRKTAESKQFHMYNSLVDFLILNQDDQARIPLEGSINTESNLSSKVLQNILFMIGISCDSNWTIKLPFIDGKLLYHRNKIVHGEYHLIDESTFMELRNLVIYLLDLFKYSIENSASLKNYRR